MTVDCSCADLAASLRRSGSGKRRRHSASCASRLLVLFVFTGTQTRGENAESDSAAGFVCLFIFKSRAPPERRLAKAADLSHHAVVVIVYGIDAKTPPPPNGKI